jgi:xylose isomerase
LLRGGGFTTGGLNFDARIRRQSIGANDVVHAHIGGLDSIAKALKAAAALIEDGRLSSFVEDRYAGWNTEEAKKLLTGETTLEAIASGFAEHPKEPTPRSGQQEYLENLLLRYQ